MNNYQVPLEALLRGIEERTEHRENCPSHRASREDERFEAEDETTTIARLQALATRQDDRFAAETARRGLTLIFRRERAGDAAPPGPWRVIDSGGGASAYGVGYQMYTFGAHDSGQGWTEREAIAVRDALNRVAGGAASSSGSAPDAIAIAEEKIGTRSDVSLHDYGGDGFADGVHRTNCRWCVVKSGNAPRESKVTRIEVIDHRHGAPRVGRVFTAWNAKIELSYQDAGRTLKVFVDGVHK